MAETHFEDPPDGLECLVTMEDITAEAGNYVEYQTYPNMLWYPALMERSVIETLLDTQFDNFLQRVKTTDCQAELKRLLKQGPPVFLSDPNGLPLGSSGDTHVCSLWYHADKTERSAKLKGAVEGPERDALWEELKQFVIVEGKEKGDDGDDVNGETAEDEEKKVTENGSHEAGEM